MLRRGQPRSPVLDELRHKLAALESSFRPTEDAGDVFPVGVEGLASVLPAGGFRRGSFVEWLADGEGVGAEMLAFRAVAPVLSGGDACVVVDERGCFYPGAAADLGVALSQLLVVRPKSPRDALWSLEQALRCCGVGVTVGWLGPVSDRALRRLQLAAETGGGLGVFFRPIDVRCQPTWADLRLLVQPESASRRIEVLYARGGVNGKAVVVGMEDTGVLQIVHQPRVEFVM